MLSEILVTLENRNAAFLDQQKQMQQITERITKLEQKIISETCENISEYFKVIKQLKKKLKEFKTVDVTVLKFIDKIGHLLYKQLIYIIGYYEMLSTSQAAEAIGVSTKTIRRWDKSNKLQSIRLASGHRRFAIQQINEFATKQSNEFKHIIYCRVSSRKQKHDLQRQIAYMQSKYPEHEIISEIASGIHYDRQGIRQILEYIKNKQLKSLIVAHKDRLTRFSFDIWQHLAEIYGFKLVVENNENESPETEIVKDIIAIVTSFAARIHGLRKYIPRKSKVFKNTNQMQ